MYKRKNYLFYVENRQTARHISKFTDSVSFWIGYQANNAYAVFRIIRNAQIEILVTVIM